MIEKAFLLFEDLKTKIAIIDYCKQHTQTESEMRNIVRLSLNTDNQYSQTTTAKREHDQNVYPSINFLPPWFNHRVRVQSKQQQSIW